MRTAKILRKTGETDISLELNLDGSGISTIATGCGFLDHMLTLFAKHGRFDLTLTCKGDTWVDDHHTVEDVGIALGQAFTQALGDKKGICRYGDTTLAMDESLILSAVDISGRFWLGFVRNSLMTLHIRQLAGTNSHHIIEGTFKSVARSLRKAVAIDTKFADDVPSTKGVL